MIHQGYLLGLDVGSSSVKASLVEVRSGRSVASSQSPSSEMSMTAVQSGWAEQDPEMWWEHAVKSTRLCLEKSQIRPESVLAIGIAYQMHGLVVVDKNQRVLRPSIIWCDSRAVLLGEQAFRDLGEGFCLSHLLNSPGNFTASKLKWVRENESKTYEQIHKIMLPGDFIAMKLTGEIQTTETGLSEGVFWDFKEKAISRKLLDYYGISSSLIANAVPVFSVQGELTKGAAEALGLKPGVKVAYRSGDQPNNAFSLNVLNPGETAATAGTSGVIYSVTDKNAFDPDSRVNTFLHVTNGSSATASAGQASARNGILLCINGTGILNRWLNNTIQSSGEPYGYAKLNEIAAQARIGSAGLVALPFGNGAERILKNKEIGASFHGVDFNQHHQAHLFRAAQEGIVFSLKYGFDILEKMGCHSSVIRAGNSNMFLSPIFREAFVNTTGSRLELYDTDGAQGAALGAGVGAGIYASFAEAFAGLTMIDFLEPDQSKQEQYNRAFLQWREVLDRSFKS